MSQLIAPASGARGIIAQTPDLISDITGIPFGVQTAIPGLSFTAPTVLGRYYRLNLDLQGITTSTGAAAEVRIGIDGVVLRSSARSGLVTTIGEIVGGGATFYEFDGDGLSHLFEVFAYLPTGILGDTMDWKASFGSPSQFSLEDIGAS